MTPALRWRISSAAMTKRSDRRIPAILGAASVVSWAPLRPAGRRRSVAMSSNAMIVVRPASPTTLAATAIARSARDWRGPQWLAERQAELLPVPYFHVVFTMPAPVSQRDRVPEQGRGLCNPIPRGRGALGTIAADPRHLGAKLGMTMVLHTWGQPLQHHPHIHCVVPGGGPSLDGTRWIACRPGVMNSGS